MATENVMLAISASMRLKDTKECPPKTFYGLWGSVPRFFDISPNQKRGQRESPSYPGIAHFTMTGNGNSVQKNAIFVMGSRLRPKDSEGSRKARRRAAEQCPAFA